MTALVVVKINKSYYKAVKIMENANVVNSLFKTVKIITVSK